MLSTITKTFLIVFILFSGCSRKDYYSSRYYKSSDDYKRLKKQKIINSKAMHRATMRPYIVGGKKYYPTKVSIGTTMRGVASWYGPNFHAKKTSNGEYYNMYAYTAAHKTWPMNTMVKVINLQNRKSVVVRINDRGPFVANRIIDLSKVAAQKIDMIKKGTAKVKLVVIGFDGKIAKTKNELSQTKQVRGYYIQVGAFKKIEGAKSVKRKFNNLLDGKYKAIIKQTIKNRELLNRVLIGVFRSLKEVEDFKNEYGLEKAIIVAK